MQRRLCKSSVASARTREQAAKLRAGSRRRLPGGISYSNDSISSNHTAGCSKCRCSAVAPPAHPYYSIERKKKYWSGQVRSAGHAHIAKSLTALLFSCALSLALISCVSCCPGWARVKLSQNLVLDVLDPPPRFPLYQVSILFRLALHLQFRTDHAPLCHSRISPSLHMLPRQGSEMS